MLSVIVGENATGKTLYLDSLYGSNDCIYNRMFEEAMMKPIDYDLLDEVFPESKVECNVVEFKDLQAFDKINVSRLLNLFIRKCDVLLLDEIDAYVGEGDKNILYRAIMDVSRYKQVYAVSHDEDITIYADAVYKLDGGKLVELNHEEMLWEIYQDEEMVNI